MDGWIGGGRDFPLKPKVPLQNRFTALQTWKGKRDRGSYQGHHQEATKPCPAVFVSWGHQEQPEEYQGGRQSPGSGGECLWSTGGLFINPLRQSEGV